LRTNTTAQAVFVPLAESRLPPNTLVLQGIKWSKTRPMAIINGFTFEAQDIFRVRIAQTNVTIRCLNVSEDSVVIQVVGSGERQTLKLKTP
jgi:hypothetical protein